jgi:glycine/D-amino acid oxidase-like deaminating enzyme
VSPGITAHAADRVLRELPALAGARVRQVWSCFRTKAPDGRFVIGPDPALDGFVWVAGLGGHGVGCSWAAGRVAAAAFRGLESELTRAFAPARLTGLAGRSASARSGSQPEASAGRGDLPTRLEG